MESSTRFDPQPEGPWRSSQLWHLDYHSRPTVYVLVAVRDIEPEDGPLRFIGQAASRRVAEATGYRRRSTPYRLDDETVEALVDPAEMNTFAVRRGTVIVIDTSKCLHCGYKPGAPPAAISLALQLREPAAQRLLRALAPAARLPGSARGVGTAPAAARPHAHRAVIRATAWGLLANAGSAAWGSLEPMWRVAVEGAGPHAS